MRSDATPAGTRDLAKIWNATRQRITALMRDQPAEVLDSPLPTVPGSTVRDALTHLIDLTSAASNSPRNLAQSALALPKHSKEFAAASLADLMERWETSAALSKRALESDPDLASVIVTATVMGEHDLRTALDAPGARDDVAIKVALDELAGRFSDRAEDAHLPPLRVTVEQWGTIIGAGRAISCVVADRFEFVRAMSGRRSAAEIERWNWGVDPSTYLPAMAEAEIPIDEVRERDPRIPQHMRDREFVL